MSDQLEVLKMAHAMAKHAAMHQSKVAQNVANADTPGYRPQHIAPFSESYRPSESNGMRTTRPGHLGQGELANLRTFPITDTSYDSPNGNGVSLETEMLKATEVRQQHQMALTIYKSTLGILRASIGRA